MNYMSNLVKHAQRELEMAGLFDKEKDFYGGMTGESVLELIKVFAGQGHSGMSASIVNNLFNRLAKFEPINPITGADEEWNEIGDETFQSNRLSAVFKKGKTGKPYYLDAIVWRTKESGSFTGMVEGITSSQNIKFPFLPKTFYIDITEDRKIIDRSQLEEVFKYYEKK
jgi:hypothetical protein